MALLFAPPPPPFSLATASKGGLSEAAVHAARLFLRTLIADHAIVKLNFKNAFNSVRHDKMLTDLVPMLFPFIYFMYSSPS